MNRYITALLFVIVTLLVGSMLFLQPHLRNLREEKIRGNFLLSIDPEKVSSIHFRNKEEAIQINRKGTDWEVCSKVCDRASPEVVTQILQAAKDLRIFDKIPEEEFKKKLKLKDFGLKSPQQCFQIGGEPEIWFGNDTSVNGRVYACKKNSQTVYVIPKPLQTLISHPFNTFRDRQLTQLIPHQIRSFLVKRGGDELEVQQEGNEWKISRPLNASADTQKVHKFLDALLSARILEFVDDESGDLGRFGIDEKSPSLSFKADPAGAPATIRIGGLSDKGGYYAQFTERKSVFLLPASIAKLLEVNVEELRTRSLLNINPDVLDRIAIRNGDQSLLLSRKGEEWQGEEQQEGKKSAVFPVPHKKIQHFLTVLRQQNMSNFLSVPQNALAAYGLDPPHSSVQFYSHLSENTPETSAGLHKIASIIFSLPSKENIIYTRKSDSPEVFQIDPAIMPLISTDPSDWK